VYFFLRRSRSANYEIEIFFSIVLEISHFMVDAETYLTRGSVLGEKRTMV